MSLYDLNPAQEADAMNVAARNPAEFGPTPWFTGRTALAPVEGVLGAGASLALMAGETLTPYFRPIAESMDNAYGTSAAKFLDDQLEQTRVAARKNAEVSPFVYGRAGELIHGLTKFGGEALVGGAVAGLPGVVAATAGSEGFTRYQQLIAEGVDPETAKLAAGVEGIAAGATSVLPLTGKTLSESIIRGAALMPWTNAFTRGVTHDVLDHAGYHDMAQTYQGLDGNALMTDGIMGALFGGIGHAFHSSATADANPMLASAALADAAARHIEGLAPGIPTDVATRNAHVDAMVKATEDILAGRQVDVSAQIDPTRANFIADPHAEAYQKGARAAMEEAYPDLPKPEAAPVAEPIPATEARLAEIAPQPKEEAPAPETTAKAEAPDVVAARNALKTAPDMTVVGDSGERIKASDLMAEADQQAADAATTKKMLDAAISCEAWGGA
jgi:hypothetical protein